MKIVRFAAFGVPRLAGACVEVPGLGAPAEDEGWSGSRPFPSTRWTSSDHQGALRDPARAAGQPPPDRAEIAIFRRRSKKFTDRAKCPNIARA